MMNIIDRPLFTKTFLLEDFVLQDESVYIYSLSREERSKHAIKLKDKFTKCEYIELKVDEDNSYSFDTDIDNESIHLRSRSSLSNFWKKMGGTRIYLDITGLPHHIWAPLILSAYEEKKDVKIIYVEPEGYNQSLSPTESGIFDLSERIKGITPLPRFASLREPPQDKVCFVPILGFEGTRFAYILEVVQPPDDKIFPIIGIPGFKPEYPFYTYYTNKNVLNNTKAWKNVAYASAYCPFSLYYTLDSIITQYSDHLFKIALIGTKPHALGAVMFAIKNSEKVELVYDHPIPNSKRTKGANSIMVYDISVFQKI